MKILPKVARKLGLMSALLAAAFGCSATAPDQAAADARIMAANAQAVVVDAHARVTAADAHVKAAQADARVEALAGGQTQKKAPKIAIPSGTTLKVFLVDAIHSDTSSAGDRFLASLAESVVINGKTRLSKGTKVRGRVIDAEGAGKVKGRALIHLELTDIVQGNNRLIPITTTAFEATADSNAGTDVVLETKGKEIHFNPETRLDFSLTNSVAL